MYEAARRMLGDSDACRFNTVRCDSQSWYRLGVCKAMAGSLVVGNVQGSLGSAVSDQDDGDTESARAEEH